MTQGNILARYTVLHELGRGATGAVYAARDRATSAVVALKRLDPALLGKSGAGLADRLVKNARSARRLKHRNIVEIHDAGEAGGTVYVAMEMLEGRSLRDMLGGEPLPVARAIRIAREIACGLAHAHLEGVVHGGIRPSSIIVLRSGAVKITGFDFGQLAQAALPAEARAGLLKYMSPEQARGEPVDHRSDVFSLGALFYEMLTRRPPLEGQAEPRPPSELNPLVPRALDALVLRMLAAQPAARMPGVPVLLRELQHVEEGLGLEADTTAGADKPAPSAPPPEPAPARRTPEPKRTQEPGRAQERPVISGSEVFDYRKAMAIMDREAARERSSGSRPAMFAAFALLLAVLGMGLTDFIGFAGIKDDLSDRIGRAASRIQEVPAAPKVMRPSAPAPVAEAPSIPPPPDPTPAPAKPAAPEPAPVAKAESPAVPAPAPEQPASAEPAPARQVPEAKQPTAKVAEQQPGGTARLILAVAPRGELYINGKHQGTTPPVTTLDLEPGMHRIEVRNGSRKPYLTYMTVEAGDVRRIRHDFNAKASRPPR